VVAFGKREPLKVRDVHKRGVGGVGLNVEISDIYIKYNISTFVRYGENDNNCMAA
jgi:hypothetical protein